VAGPLAQANKLGVLLSETPTLALTAPSGAESTARHIPGAGSDGVRQVSYDW